MCSGILRLAVHQTSTLGYIPEDSSSQSLLQAPEIQHNAISRIEFMMEI
jgi:hypothetical protein